MPTTHAICRRSVESDLPVAGRVEADCVCPSFCDKTGVPVYSWVSEEAVVDICTTINAWSGLPV